MTIRRMTVAAAAPWVFGASLAATAAPKAGGGLDTAAIEQLTGAKGVLDAKEGVFKVMLPRGDIKATAAGVKMTPPLGLGAWAAFTKAGRHTYRTDGGPGQDDQVRARQDQAPAAGRAMTAEPLVIVAAGLAGLALRRQ